MSSEAASPYFSCNDKQSLSVYTAAFNKALSNSCEGRAQEGMKQSRCNLVGCYSSGSRQRLPLRGSAEAGDETAGRTRVWVTETPLTLRGDSPPTYTKSTSCRFNMCSNICLLGRARTAGLETTKTKKQHIKSHGWCKNKIISVLAAPPSGPSPPCGCGF